MVRSAGPIDPKLVAFRTAPNTVFLGTALEPGSRDGYLQRRRQAGGANMTRVCYGVRIAVKSLAIVLPCRAFHPGKAEVRLGRQSIN